MTQAGSVVDVSIKAPIADRRLYRRTSSGRITDSGSDRQPACNLAVIESSQAAVPGEAEKAGRGYEHPGPRPFPHQPVSDLALAATEGETSLLPGKGRGEFRGGNSGRADQGEVFSIAIETEIRVKLLSGSPPVLAGGEHHQVASRAQVHLRQGPLEEIFRVIAQVPAPERGGLAAAVIELDPIWAVAIRIGESTIVHSEKFADHDILLRAQASRRKKAEKKQEPVENSTHLITFGIKAES